jgi:hypothetical protein
MRSFTAHFDQLIPLSQFRVWLIASCAVQDGVSLDDYLIHRLCDDQAQGRRSRFPLSFYVVIEQGKPIASLIRRSTLGKLSCLNDKNWQQGGDYAPPHRR